MPTAEITVDGTQREFVTEEIVECRTCGFRWMRQHPPADIEEKACPSCERASDWQVLAEEIRGRSPEEIWDFDEVETIGELADLFELRAAELRTLSDRGWRLREEVPVGLDHIPGKPRQISPFLARMRE